MIRFIVMRTGDAILVLLGVSVLVFLMVHLTGDPTSAMLPPDATEEQVARLRAQLGLDRPLYEQYFDYLFGVLRGDLGTSLRGGQPVLGLVLERLPATLWLASGALIVALVIGGVLGVVAAAKRGSIIDGFASGIALLGQSLPVFWLALMAVLIVGVQWRLLPTSGSATFAHSILPILTLAAYSTAMILRMLRSSMLGTFSEPYIRTAWGKGLPGSLVVGRHALRNALVPVVTIVGLQFGALLGGAVVTETIFAWPGIGRLAIQAIASRDLPIVQAVVLVAALLFVLVNLLVDIVCAALDPRIRLHG